MVKDPTDKEFQQESWWNCQQEDKDKYHPPGNDVTFDTAFLFITKATSNKRMNDMTEVMDEELDAAFHGNLVDE